MSFKIRNIKGIRINNKIYVSKVRLIDSKGKQVGIIDTKKAIKMSRIKNLDLVEISPNSVPPVCKIMDYGKFKFNKIKKFSASRKKIHHSQLKEIKFRPSTGEADYQVKLRKILNFIKKGDKVRTTVNFRGREITHKDLGIKIINRIKNDLKNNIFVEVPPKIEGRQIIMILSSFRNKNVPFKNK